MSRQTHSSTSQRAASGIEAVGSAASSSGAAATPPAAMAVDVKPAQPSRTQRAIQATLKACRLDFQEMLETLARMEVRGLPTNVSAAQRKPAQLPRTCCFDAADQTWTAGKLCARCGLFNQVLQVRVNGNNSETINGLLDSAYNCTDCSSDTQRTGTLPLLPCELLDFVADYAIADMQSIDDGVLVAALLHVSPASRRKVEKAFTPIRLFARHSSESFADELLVPRELDAFIWENCHWHFFEDFGKRLMNDEGEYVAPAQGHSLVKPKPQFSNSQELLSTINFRGSNYVCVRVTYTLHAPAPRINNRRFRARKMAPKSWTHLLRNENDDDNKFVTIEDACRTADDTMTKVYSMQSSDEEWPWKHFANPYHRALQGNLGPPEASATIEVRCCMHSEGPTIGWQMKDPYPTRSGCSRRRQLAKSSASSS